MQVNLNEILSAALTAAVAEATKPLLERITYLERHAAAADGAAILVERIDRLEAKVTNDTGNLWVRVATLTERIDNITTASDERIHEIAMGAAHSVMDEHHEAYDHDDYDNVVGKCEGVDFDDYVTEDKLDDMVSEAVRNLTFEVSVS